jgi:hypothetical protein
LTGDCGVGAFAFRVSPLGPASVVPGCAELGETGESEFLEHATASASTTTDVHAENVLENLLLSMRKDPSISVW